MSRIGATQCIMRPPIVSSVDVLLKRMQARALVSMIRVGDYFLDFDKLRHGYCSQTQFRQVLKRCTFEFSDADFANLVDHYAQSHPVNRLTPVCYRQFQQDLESVLYDRELPVAPTHEGLVRPPVEEVVAVLHPRNTNNLTPEEWAMTEETLKRFKQIAHDCRYVTITPYFQDFDLPFGRMPLTSTSTGTRRTVARRTVTRRQFRQVLNTLRPPMDFATEAEFEAFAKRYGSAHDPDVVNYFDFAADLLPPIEGYRSRPPDYICPHTQHHRPLDELLYKLALAIQHTRVRLIEFFKDFDGLRRGYVTFQKMRSAMSMAKFVITEPEYRVLEAEFVAPSPPAPPNSFLYTELCDRLELVFTQHRLVREPTHELADYATIKPVEQVPPQVADRCEEILCTLAERIRLRRLSVKPFLANMDRQKTGRITKEQFIKVLHCSAVNLEYLTPDEIEVLYARYRDDTGLFRYHFFMADVEARTVYRGPKGSHS